MKLNLTKKKNNPKGITLVALVITIIILLILAGITISSLIGSGLFARTNDAKIETKMSEIEEFATMKIYDLHIENVDNMDVVNDATITTALKAELLAKGYKIKDVNTTSETLNALKIQDSTGQNNFDSISLLQQKNTTIKVDLDITSQSKTYIKIYDSWYELIINDKTVKVSREKNEEPVGSENTYEIKLTPPTSGITMTVGETQITDETTITPGALITIKAGNDIGTFAFTVKETTSSVTKNVDVNVTADPAYATDLSIAVDGGGNAEVAPGKTLQLVATKTPTTSTDTVIWSIKSGSATIDATGLITANNDTTDGSTITVSATCNREDGTTSTVGEKTFVIKMIQISKLIPVDYVSSSDWSSEYSPARAFDGIDYTYWHATDKSKPQYCGAKFNEKVHVNYFKLNVYYKAKDIVIQGSNDGLNWVDIQSYVARNGVLDLYEVTNEYTENYYYYCIKTISSDNYVAYRDMEFYGY